MNLEQIDTSTTAGKAEVMRLAAEGRRVAFAEVHEPIEWRDCPKPSWGWDRFLYAIIAEPVGPEEVFVTVCEGDPIDVYKSETTAICSNRLEVVRYIRADLAGERG